MIENYNTFAGMGGVNVCEQFLCAAASLAEFKSLLLLTTATAFGRVPTSADHLVLDLDRDDRIKFMRRANGVNFEIDANGFAKRIGSVSIDDGLHVRNLNANCLIESIGEPIGNHTTPAFTTLAAFDTSAGGRFSALGTTRRSFHL